MTSTPIESVADLGTVLGVWAHPDDEAYLMAGTALLALAEGARVACVTATAGEAGETADESRWPQASLADIRRDEMADSLRTLGIDDHVWLGLPDGGLASIDADRGVALVAEVVERVRPDTVLTFGTDGMTGHPDHVTIGDWAQEATRRTGGVAHVLAATKTEEWVQRFPTITDMVFPDGAPCTAPSRLALTVELEGQMLDRKIGALDAQASQTSGLATALGTGEYRASVQDEYWVRREG